MRYLTVMFLLLLAAPAAAQQQRYLATDGGLYEFKENRYGAVLTLVERSLGEGLRRSDLRVGQSLYLGRACDAFSLKFGDGVWNWTDGGFFVAFGDLRFAFPGQSIDFVPGDRCRI